MTFATNICNKLGETADGSDITVLAVDDTVFCEDSSHRTLQAISFVIIALVVVSLPLLFGFVLIRASRQHQRDAAGKNKEIAQRIAKELDRDEDEAAWVVRDVIIGRDYSFLMDAYAPKYLYCKYRYLALCRPSPQPAIHKHSECQFDLLRNRGSFGHVP